jgi:hypothetical protein
MASTLGSTYAGAYAPPRDAARAGTTDFAWHAYAVVLAAAMVITGLLWDISWHMSIGRDTFWTPAHLLIQGGGLIAGAGSAYLALRTTFFGTAAEKASAVSFWGFRAPLGAWVCVLGCGAMLTSAPFDDWWHNAYGLDVRIVSPPHILLGEGMLGIVMGALLRTLALQNGDDEVRRARASLLFAVSSGLLLTIDAVFLLEYSHPTRQHLGTFYSVVSRSVPLLLVAVAVAGRRPWPATTAAAVYLVVMAGTSWLLMLFSATPKLGPIYQQITHYVPLDFPMLFVVPALAIDLVWRRMRERPRPIAGWRIWLAAPVFGVAFVAALVAAQWPYSSFVLEHGRNWFFHLDNFVYWQPHSGERWAFVFRDARPNESQVMAFALAVVFATISSAIGLAWGRWMTRVKR